MCLKLQDHEMKLFLLMTQNHQQSVDCFKEIGIKPVTYQLVNLLYHLLKVNIVRGSKSSQSDLISCLQSLSILIIEKKIVKIVFEQNHCGLKKFCVALNNMVV